MGTRGKRFHLQGNFTLVPNKMQYMRKVAAKSGAPFPPQSLAQSGPLAAVWTLTALIPSFHESSP
jgi:hypothetical protein